jgi:nitroreductase
MSEQAKIFDEVVASRRSLRAYLPQAVDKQTLEQVFSVALRAPSNSRGFGREPGKAARRDVLALYGGRDEYGFPL